jgi:hypothetical protein
MTFAGTMLADGHRVGAAVGVGAGEGTGAAVEPGGSLGGSGVAGPGLGDGGFSSSTVAPSRTARLQPGLMLFGA